MRNLVALTALVLAFGPAAAAWQDAAPQDTARSAADRVAGLEKEFNEKQQAAYAGFAKLADAGQEAQQKFLVENMPRPEEFAKRFLEVAQEAPEDPAALDALIWVVSNAQHGEALTESVDILIARHMSAEKLGDVCDRLSFSLSGDANRLTMALLEKSPHETVRAKACYCAARQMQSTGMIAGEIAQADAMMLEQMKQFFGAARVEELKSLGTEGIAAKVEALLDRTVREFGDVDGGKIAERAKRDLFAIRELAIGKTAPEISGEDIDGVAFKLSDYRGKVVLLDFWGDW